MSSERDRRPKTRARRLKKSPLCVECLKLGITKATEEIDHIIPLEQGGPDTDENTQGLCVEHNRAKRNRESYGHVSYGEDGWPEEGGLKSLGWPIARPLPPH